jgi:hypothetical protein
MNSEKRKYIVIIKEQTLNIQTAFVRHKSSTVQSR